MFIELLISYFLFSNFNQPTEQEFGLQPFQTVTAAEVEGMQVVEGFDEYTGQSYNHRLPLPEIESTGVGPKRLDETNLGVLTSADSILVLDRRTKKVLYEQASKEQRSIASITKLMTALVLLDQEVNFDQVITIASADKIVGGRIWVYTGEQFLLQDLWMAGLIASDNVAIRALVRNSGLSPEAFIQAMNDKAVELEMFDTQFTDPTGIHSGNISTAHDISILMDEAFSHVSISDAVRRPVYTFSPLNKEELRTIDNTNKLLQSYLNAEPYELLGGKTGFTFEAGYCLGVIADGQAPNDEIIAIVLGADTLDARFQELKGIIDWVYRNFEW